jgi:NADH dehydrogenase/NADH:ubiquinone oxidoreductase subunit G
MELTIDGQLVTAEPDETVLQCAARHGIEIPHLCTHPSLPAFGACRMCIVEIEGMRGHPTSCTTPATQGMVVHTNTDELRRLRRNILGLIMIEHPNACLVCGRRDQCEQFRPKSEKVGRTTGCHTCNNKEVCEVRVLSADLGLTETPVPPMYHERPLERSEPFMDRDLNLCILCGRCVRICKHQHETAAIDFVGRSSGVRIGQAFGRSLLEAGCRFCGSCVDVCPTGSLADRYAKWYGKPDADVPTTCIFCDEGCALMVRSTNGKTVSAHAVNGNIPACVLGRFAIPEFLNGNDRLRVPYIRVGKVLREVSWEDALRAAAEKLPSYQDGSFAFVCDTTTPLEDRHVFRRFTAEVMKSDHFIELQPDASGACRATLPAGVKAAFLTGDFVDAEALGALDLLIVQDCYPTTASSRAEVVFPAAVFAETQGTILDAGQQPRPLRQACIPPGQAHAEWRIVCNLAQAMGSETLAYDETAAITAELGFAGAALGQDRASAPPAAKDPRVRRLWFRGHHIEDKVRGLKELNPQGAEAEIVAAPAAGKGRFTILSKREVVPNNHEIVVHAPEVARKAKPGQFAIVMADETSERVPYTLCDWDVEKGSITFVVQEKGQSSRKLVLMQAGDELAHVVGPLGIPLEIKKYGNVVLAAGCYGIGAILRIAKAMREAGNHVTTICEARSHYLGYYGEQLTAVSDEFIQTAIDGSLSVRGHAADVIAARLKKGDQIDCVVAVGCPFMMMITSQETKPYAVKTLAALNPIMVDGTGMCGACRISVGSETKFACVDGPFFDAHLVDWDEVRDRREAYSAEEIQSVGRTEPVEHRHHHHGGKQSCACVH